MSLKKKNELYQFLITYFSEADESQDEEILKSFANPSTIKNQPEIISQAKQYGTSPDTLPDTVVEELGMELNRWFEDKAAASAWLNKITQSLESVADNNSQEIIVKDSNGTVLVEGDSVQVIKDLKVKGGSSDLKRGTLIKNIHLIDDSENIEAKFDGSTLVLKTMFLKKS